MDTKTGFCQRSVCFNLSVRVCVVLCELSSVGTVPPGKVELAYTISVFAFRGSNVNWQWAAMGKFWDRLPDVNRGPVVYKKVNRREGLAIERRTTSSKNLLKKSPERLPERLHD